MPQQTTEPDVESILEDVRQRARSCATKEDVTSLGTFVSTSSAWLSSMLDGLPEFDFDAQLPIYEAAARLCGVAAGEFGQLATTHEDDEVHDVADGLAKWFTGRQRYIDAQRSMIRGQSLRQDLSYTEAVMAFRKAAELFGELARQTGQPLDKLHAADAEAWACLSESDDLLARCNYGAARLAFARLQQRLEALLGDANTAAAKTELDDDTRAQAAKLASWLAGVCLQAEGWVHLPAAYEALEQGEHELARDELTLVLASYDKANAASAEDAPSPLGRTYETDRQQALAYLSLCEAEILRKQRRFDEAAAAYRKYRQHALETAQAFALENPQSASPMSESLVNSVTVWVASSIRQLDHEREETARVAELELELTKLRDAVSGSLRQSGVIVNANSSAEVSAAVTQTVHQVTIAERMAREVLGQAADQLRSAASEHPEVQRLAEEAQQLAKEPEGGSGFLDKVQRFAERAARVLEPFGTLASAVAPLVRPFIGL
jgi:hypothetical protein